MARSRAAFLSAAASAFSCRRRSRSDSFFLLVPLGCKLSLPLGGPSVGPSPRRRRAGPGGPATKDSTSRPRPARGQARPAAALAAAAAVC